MLTGSGPGEALFSLLVVLPAIPFFALLIGYLWTFRKRPWHSDETARAKSEEAADLTARKVGHGGV